MLKNIETIWLTELNLSQLTDVKRLLSDCEKYDNGGPIIYPRSLLHTRLPAINGLVYYQRQLIAFVSAYFFYKTACECSLMVFPDYRRRGVAKSLLQTLIPVLKSQHMKAVYFSTSPFFPVHRYPQLSLHSSEYQLTHSTDQTDHKQLYRLNFRSATLADIDTLGHIDQACFANHDTKTMAQRFQELIKNPHYYLLIGELNGKVISKAHIQWEKQQAILSDIAVLPEYQRQGFGGETVRACLQESKNHSFKQAMLEVESSNQPALKLYLNLGFKIKKETKFWKMKI